MERCAIFSYVTTTRLNYSSEATQGVEGIARKLKEQLVPAFRDNIHDLGPFTTRNMILSGLEKAATKLDKNGLCLFYFHGHGDSVPGSSVNDEVKDQVLVCNDQYLLDDDLDVALRRFSPGQRILSIVDSCSSQTVVEWSKYPSQRYPQIIHLASARDDADAMASINGGLFSSRIFRMVYGFAYEQMTYQAFITRLTTSSITEECYVSISPNTTQEYLNTKLFQ